MASASVVSNDVTHIISKGVKNLEHMIQLKKLGPPRPVLNITQEQKASKARNGFMRKFSTNLYANADWLCGCQVNNAFFCYSCLVMGAADRSWTVEGVSDIKHLSVKARKHQSSEKHIGACIDYAVLGKVEIKLQLDNAYRSQIQKLNEEVSKNRYILSKLIDAVKFCGSFDSASRCQVGKETSDNPGIFRGLVNLMAELDSTLKQHIEQTNNRVFSGLSKTIQNKLLDSMYEVCLEMIREELGQTQYIAVEVDETTDCATLSQLVLVVRYELKGSVHERFVGFVSPKGHDAASVSEAIFDELRKLKVDETPDKVVAQSYDGTSVMSGAHTGVQARVRDVYQNARFVHCYAHELNSVIERSATQNKQVKVFFSNIDAFSSFFSSTKRTAVLDDLVQKGIPKSPKTRWDWKSRIVSTIFKYSSEIEESLNKLIDDVSNDYSTVNKAVGLIHILKDEDFNFWLTFFNKIMPHCDVLHKELHHRAIDCSKASKSIDKFTSVIQSIRNTLELDDGQDTSDLASDSEPSRKRLRFEDKRNVGAKQVCDVIMTEIDNRFANLDYLSVAKLFQPSLFRDFKETFPERELETAAKMFPLNKVQLRQELSVIYSRSDFSQATGSLRILNFIYDNNLKEVLSESVKLLQIICTIPMTTAESERCFSTLKMIKTFTRSTMEESRLSALAMCSMEKTLLSRAEFNERVINHFAERKERRNDFSYKQFN